MVDGIRFDSVTEAIRYRDLKMWLDCGEVRQIRLQPVYHLGCPENTYRADFEVTYRDGEVWTEDVKGFETAKFKHDRRLWASYGPNELRILKRVRGRWQTESIKGGGK